MCRIGDVIHMLYLPNHPVADRCQVWLKLKNSRLCLPMLLIEYHHVYSYGDVGQNNNSSQEWDQFVPNPNCT
eukprot:scaffold12938_cov138-Skeletonema_marinoi.AAC.1